VDWGSLNGRNGVRVIEFRSQLARLVEEDAAYSVPLYGETVRAAVRSAGAVLLATEQQLMVYRGKKREWRVPLSGAPTQLFASGWWVWIQWGNSVLLTDTLRQVVTTIPGQANKIHLVDEDGNALIASQNHLRWTNQTKTVGDQPMPEAIVAAFRRQVEGSRVEDVVVSATGEIWTGSAGRLEKRGRYERGGCLDACVSRGVLYLFVRSALGPHIVAMHESDGRFVEGRSQGIHGDLPFTVFPGDTSPTWAGATTGQEASIELGRFDHPGFPIHIGAGRRVARIVGLQGLSPNGPSRVVAYLDYGHDLWLRTWQNGADIGQFSLGPGQGIRYQNLLGTEDGLLAVVQDGDNVTVRSYRVESA